MSLVMPSEANEVEQVFSIVNQVELCLFGTYQQYLYILYLLYHPGDKVFRKLIINQDVYVQDVPHVQDVFHRESPSMSLA